ncbi:MAG: FkbM family methyltransferase [Chloroflexota bacterium]
MNDFIKHLIVKRCQNILRNLLKKKDKGVLVYVGAHRGSGLDRIAFEYEKCFVFEANPELIPLLKKKYSIFHQIEIVHGAVTSFDGTITLNVSSAGGSSSSLGKFKGDWPNASRHLVEMVKEVAVPAINLNNYIASKGVDRIDTYVSDIQGMDLEVLKTLKKLIDEKRIGTIISETAKDERGNIYEGLPDNSESGFKALLGENYYLAAKGWSFLKEGVFQEVPEDWWEMDCMWKLKK